MVTTILARNLAAQQVNGLSLLLKQGLVTNQLQEALPKKAEVTTLRVRVVVTKLTPTQEGLITEKVGFTTRLTMT